MTIGIHKRSLGVAVLLLYVFFDIPGYARPHPGHKWILTWSDEFNGPNGTPPDSQKWTAESGGNGWGNNELEYYTTSPHNARQERGSLVIEAIREPYTGPDGVSRSYTSARLKTAGKFSQKYGRFEARIKMPRGKGIWPAFWMLGDDISSIGWPKCGEIDIVENLGSEPSIAHGTIHGPGYSGGHGIGSPFSLPNNKHFSDNFHLFAVEWEPQEIRFYVDDHLYATRRPADLPPGAKWVYDHPFFIILNLAVGGNWPGNPDETTQFPQKMLVDYVRVYRLRSP
ncbi:MAG TPA: glycoside hydrolase family 16 protein [Terriglobales bacterium]|nr:glycoside hydrolase family 16 protein [Terriglobales bacterium]